MKPIVIFSLILMLFFTTFIPACTTPSAPDPSPQGILKTYIQEVNDRDAQAVREALSSGLQSQYDHAYETTGRDPVHDAIYGLERQGATIQTMTIINQTITGQTATVEVDYFWHYPGIYQINEQRQAVEFENEGGAWKLTTFFPFEGQNILSETSLASVEQSPTTTPQKDLSEAINYSDIRLFAPDPVKTNTSYIAKIALNDEHAKQLLAHGGIIDDTAGRLHSCPKGSSDCYHPAVVIRYGVVPFTIEVDEDTGKIFRVFAGVPDYPNPYTATPGLYRIQNTTDNTVSVYNNTTLIMIYNATSFMYLREPGNGTP
jgi:hypothetical protein